MRYVRVLKAATRANQDDRQTLVLVYVEKGKGRRTGTHFADNPVAIANGWQTVNGAFNAEVEGEWTTFQSTAFPAMLDQLSDVIYVQSEPEARKRLAQPYTAILLYKRIRGFRTVFGHSLINPSDP